LSGTARKISDRRWEISTRASTNTGEEERYGCVSGFDDRKQREGGEDRDGRIFFSDFVFSLFFIGNRRYFDHDF
jgi:hypothetical protein